MPAHRDLAEQVWSGIDQSDAAGCWPWTRATDGHGYGHLTNNYRSLQAHRAAWELANGPIPADLQIDHICRNRICCNPNHLQLVTSEQNSENLSSRSAKSAAGIRGVYRTPRGKPFEVKVQKRGQRIYGGRFATIEDAEEAAKALRCSVMTNNIEDRI